MGWPYSGFPPPDLPDKPVNEFVEPDELVAGDTFHFKRTLADYLAPAWSLAYSGRAGNGQKIDITSTASGTDHDITIAAATTQTWLEGRYLLEGYAVNAGTGERHMIYRAWLKIRENLAAKDGSFDPRSHARKVLDAIEAVLEGRATDDIMDSTIEGVQIRRMTVPDLILLRDRYLGEWRRELEAERLKKGLGSKRLIKARFGHVA